jgi:carboxyl-terminal processing protease
MQRFFRLGFLAFLLVSNLPAAETAPPADVAPQFKAGSILTARLLEQLHFTQHPVDPSMADEWLKSYMQSLDYSRMFFLQGDYDALEKKLAPVMVQQAKEGDVAAALEVYDLFKQRVKARAAWVQDRLKKPFNFGADDYFSPDRSKADWPKTAAEADTLWEERLKFELLQDKLADKPVADADKDKDKPKAADTKGKDGKPVQKDAKAATPDKDKDVKTADKKAEPEDPVQKLARRYDSSVKLLTEFDEDEIIRNFLSSLTMLYDPHSQYLSPNDLEDFSITIKLSLVGIGAVLTTEDGYCVVKEIVPGGPADKDKQIKINDKIEAVAQGDGIWTDIRDMKLRNAVRLIRGEKGTVVRLKVIPGDATDPATRKEIKLVRDKIDLSASRAKGEVIEQTGPDGKKMKMGVIELTSFYGDGADDPSSDGQAKRSVTDDVKELIAKLNAQGIQGLVIDLRRNGGGLLDEAVRLTGLFIDHGPVVQVKDQKGKIRVLEDDVPGVSYKGPLVVLTSRQSASASEIFAGALQDYHRAVIVGDASTHGKGTVQAVVELGRFFPPQDGKQTNAGALKLTIQQFYLPGGASTQNRGVVSDIPLPSPNDYLEIGESSLPHALPWSQVSPAIDEKGPKAKETPAWITELRKLSEKRIATSQDYKYLLEDIERFREKLSEKKVSLNEDKREEEKKEADARADARKKERAARTAQDTKITPVLLDGAVGQDKSTGLEDELEGKSPEEESLDAFAADLHLMESLRILSDWIGIQIKKQDSAVATTATPPPAS